MLAQQAALLKRALPLTLGLLCLWLLWQKGGTLDWSAVRTAFDDISAPRWFTAIFFTAASFWSLAQYDLIAHRHFGTGAKHGVARRSGASAIALGQVIGCGPAVGAAVRWRLMPGLGHARILKLTAFVTLTFLAAWSVLSLTLALPVLAGLPWLSIVALPALLIAGAALLLRYPRITVAGHSMRLPSLPAAGQLVALAFCDMVFAALALYILLPPDIGLPLVSLVSAYALALGAGLVGGTPGGVGPFELALASLLPHVDMEILAASLLAYRACYYALPCMIGAGYALASRATHDTPAAPDSAPLTGPRAEHAIAAQADALALKSVDGEACLLRSPQSLTLFLGPTHGDLAPLLSPLKDMAREQNRIPCLYKVEGRDAATLRRAGWKVAPVAREAILCPRAFTLQGSDRRQLRRALRKAENAGVTTRQITRPDWEAMEGINIAWAEAHGGERGLTMGRFCPGFLADKPLFGAFLGERLIGFASCVESASELSLDLMRHLPGAPAGTMHALVMALLDHARLNGHEQVNLAAVPHCSLDPVAKGAAGLTRFKKSFGPRWRTLYIAAPSRLALTVSALDLWLAIRFPAPLPALSHGLSHDNWEANPGEAGETSTRGAQSDAQPIGAVDAPLPERLAG